MLPQDSTPADVCKSPHKGSDNSGFPGFLTEEELDAKYPPVRWSAVHPGLRGDLDAVVATVCQAGCSGGPEPPCVAPAAGGFPDCQQSPPHTPEHRVKGSGGPAFLGEQAALPTDSLDLSTRHIWPCRNLGTFQGFSGALEIALGGSLTRLKCVGLKGKRPDTATRGKIHGFSSKSRLRLLDKFAAIDRTRCRCKPLFVALTYHFAEDIDLGNPKRHLWAFLKRMAREFGQFATVWRMEAQGRGVMHFHLLLWTPQFIPWEWMAANWNAIVAPSDLQHLKSWGRIERVRSWRGVMSYVSKYIAKTEEFDRLPEGMGRRWGIINGHMLPMSIVTYTHSFETFLQMRAAINGKRAAMGLDAGVRSPFQGTRVYQPYEEARQLLRFLREDEPTPERVHDAPLFPDSVEPSAEWKAHMLPAWERKRQKQRTLEEIAGSIKLKWETRRE